MNQIRYGRLLSMILVGVLAALAPAARSVAADDVSQARPVATFDRILISGAFDAEITCGTRTAHVEVRAARDTIDRVTTEVRDGTLTVGMRSGGTLRRAPHVTVKLPTLARLRIEGAGSAHIAGLTGSDTAIENAGAATIVASGRAGRETILLDGAGTIDAAAVAARDVSVENNGVGNVAVRASGLLTMNVNGIGNIRYAGEPTHVESHVTGIGRIERL